VKIWQVVASEQPNELIARVAALELADRIDGEPSTRGSLEIADSNRRLARHSLGGGEPRLVRGHILRFGFQRVPRRDEPPHLIEPKRADCAQADPTMSPVRRVEGTAEEADARHAPQLA
jgi:hypothetical protein